MIGTIHIPTNTTNPIPPNTFLISCDEDKSMSTESDTNPPTTGIKFPMANLAVFTENLSKEVTYKPCIDTNPRYTVNTAPKATIFICLIKDDNLFSFILSERLFMTNMANAIDMVTKIKFLNTMLIAAIPPINIVLRAVDVIGRPISTNRAIIIGMITFTKPITLSIVE